MDLKLRNFLVWIYLAVPIFLHDYTYADNLALGKPARQSGTYDGNTPERAVDGDTATNIHKGSCAHPHSPDLSLDEYYRQMPAWWYVDLADGDPSKSYVIKNVTIYFRSDCCTGRTKDNEIRVGNTPNVSEHTTCASVTTEDTVQTFPCEPTMPVRYLSIKHKTEKSIGLCEVIVDGYEYRDCPTNRWGENCVKECGCDYDCSDITGSCKDCPDTYFGKGCTSQCNCEDVGEDCNPRDGFCNSGCADGFRGINCSIDAPVINDAPHQIIVDATSVTIEFVPSVPPAEQYSLEYAEDVQPVYYNRGEWVSHVDNQPVYRVTQRQLKQNTRYRIRVVPYIVNKAFGESPALIVTTLREPLPQVTYIGKGLVTETSVTLQFRVEGPMAEYYQIQYKTTGDYINGTKVNHHANGDEQVATQDNLGPGTSYLLRIIPLIPSQNKEGQPSMPVTATTLDKPRFDSQGSVTRSSVEPTSITILFFPSEPAAESYQIEYRKRGEQDFKPGVKVPHENTGGHALSATQDGLQPNTEYQLQVIPVVDSRSFRGEPSSPISITTKPAPSTPSSTAPTIHQPPPTTPQPVPTGSSEPPGATVVGPEGKNNNGPIIAAVIVVLLLLIIIALIIFFVVRRKKKGKPLLPFASKFSNIMGGISSTYLTPPSPVDQNDDTDKGKIEGPQEIKIATATPVPSMPSTPVQSVPSTPDPRKHEVVTMLPAIKVQDLSQHIKTMKDTTDAYKEEFKKLPIGATAKWDVGNKQENRNKNRFLNIRAYDHSRVVLDTLEDDLHSDYINADYISGYDGNDKTYIAAQGPKKGTIDDTWRMVWQTGTNRIIMVTNLVEGGRIKCDQYWPDKGTATYGNIKVTLLSIDHYAAYLIRIFTVECGVESRTIRQFHFTSWPDHGVPTVGTELLEFRRRVKSFDKEATGPLVIHCSAGVGRTGTYIAIDFCLQQAREENEVNIWGITYQMRTERVNMIQTLDQYIFVYDAIQEALISGETIIVAAKFKKEYGRLCDEDPETNKTPLIKQFETLEILKTPPQDTKPLVALEPDNIKKNRFTDIVPSNRFRPFLSSMVEGTTSYINAVYVDGFRAKLAYLVTQMPLPHTVVDFWRLMHDHHSSTIIMLNQVDKNDEDTGVYWPDDKDQTMTFGPLEVSLTSVNTEHKHITIRDFKIVSAKTRRTPLVRQFQLTSWPKDDAFPESKASLLEVMDMLEKWQQQTGNGPVTIHCMDGASRCGLFVASLYANEQLKVDQAVDVFGAVKQVRIPRPQFIQDIDQYKFVHEMVLEYMCGFGEYSNFS